MTLFHQRIFKLTDITEDFDKVLEIYLNLLEFIDLKRDHYQSKRPTKFTFRFHLSLNPSVKTIKLDNVIKEIKIRSKTNILANNVTTEITDKFRMPKSSNIEAFGTIINQKGNEFTVLKSGTSNLIFKITKNDNINKYILYNKINDVLLQFSDTLGINELTFTRTYPDRELHYVNGELGFSIKDQPTKYFNIPKVKKGKLNNDHLFLDIETKEIKYSLLQPLVISVRDKNKS
jgi:hypothetical protein